MATLKRRALSALMALVLVLGLLPGGVLAYEGETDGSGTATITVVDEAGEPLEGITVSLYDRDSGDDSWSEEPVNQQTTDEDGQAVFTILQERSYKAHADGGDGEPTFRLDATETEVRETIKLKAAENDGESDPSMAPASNSKDYNTTVTVRDASYPYSAIENAQVKVSHGLTKMTATTDSDGKARFDLPRKTLIDYSVSVTADGYQGKSDSVNKGDSITIYLSRDGQSGDYTFRDTGSQNVNIYYSVGGKALQEMTPRTSIQVDGNEPVMFFVGATDGSNPVTDFTDASDNQAKEIQAIDSAPSPLKFNRHSYDFSGAIQAAKDNGCTMEFHYSQFAPEYKTRTFRFVTDKTELDISYQWTGAPSGVTLPAAATVTYGSSYTVDQTYFQGKTVTVGGITYVFSGWTASNKEAWVVSNDGITGTVKGNVVFSGSWTVQQQQTYDAAFFLRIDREIQHENGTTSYSSKGYLPEHQADGTGHFWGKITGTAFVEGGEDSVVKDLTKEGVEAVKEKFKSVSNVIASAPSLTGTSNEDQRFQQMVLDNFAVTAEQLKSGEVGVLWYVAKVQDSSVCHHHVDGVLYNIKTGKPIQPKYKLTVTHEYYTYWMDGTTEKDLTKVGSSETVYTNETEKTVSVTSLMDTSYDGNTYDFFESNPSGEKISYTQDGATITLKYKREVPAPQLYYSYTFQYYYKALGQDDYTRVHLTDEQQNSVTTSDVGPVSEYPTPEALWNSVTKIPACPAEGYSGSFSKAEDYAEGEVTKSGTTYTIHVYLEQAPYQFAIRYQLFEVVNGVVQSDPKIVDGSADNSYGPDAPSPETVLSKTDSTYRDEDTSRTYARYDVYDHDLTNQVSQSGEVRGTGANKLTYTVNYYRASFTGGYLTISKTITGVPATDTAAWEELCELTFTVQKQVEYVITDSFSGTVSYRSEQWEDVKGLTEIPITEFTGFEFKNDTYTSTCETLLPAGTYRVVENGGDLSSLGYTWNLDGEDPISSEVTVAADGASKTASILNDYTGKTYTIIFDAGSHGQVQNEEGSYMEPGNTTEYHWGQVTPEERAAYYKWISAVKKDGTGSTIRYTFTQNDYLEYGNTKEMSIPAPGLKDDAGWSSDGSFYNGETAYTTLAAAYKAMNDAKTTSITYTANYTADEVTYAVDFYYQNDDGTYPTTPTASVPRKANTGTSVSVTDADKTPDTTRNTATQTYHFDNENASNVLTAKVAGDGSTHLKVYFYWTAGVTYQYQPAGLPEAITEAHPLPSDTADYRSGDTTTNQGAANGTTVQTANGSWTLNWDRLNASMTAQGVTYTGTWTFTANGQSTACVQFVDENGNDLWARAHTEANPYTRTGDYETSYDFSAAEKETSFQVGGLTYTFSKDYDGTFAAGKEDQTVAYTGTLQPGGRTITRVYAVETQTVTVTKHYDINALPGSFQVTITDNDANQAQVTVLTLADATVDGRTATWQTALPKGHSYTFAESGFSNGSRWSTELTARWLQQVSNTEQAWQDLTVTNFSFVLPEVDGNTLEVKLTNDYTYDSKDDDDDDDPVVIPDKDTPTTDLPDEETPTTDLPDEQTPTTEQPTTDLPDEETPMAEAPKTGDNSATWILAAGVSGLALVWLAITDKKRRDNEHQA